MTVKIESDAFGQKSVVSGHWTDGDAEAFARLRPRRLEVRGYRGQDLTFLDGLDSVEEVNVLDFHLCSDAGVQVLPGLRALGLETYSGDPIDFRVFSRLRRLALYWRPDADTALGCQTLESLWAGHFPYADLTQLSTLANLEGLCLSSSRRLMRLEGVESLPALRVLSLRDDRALADIGALAGMDHSLTEFELNVCRKVSDLSPLALHWDLRRVMLIDCGRIASLAPLADLPALEEFWFYGTTVIEDGDMTPLLKMPALQRVSFAPRRHYSHRTQDIERLRGLTESVPLPHWRW